MRSITVLLIVCAITASSFAAQVIVPADSKNPGKCIYEGKELAPGKNNEFTNSCMEAFCEDSGSFILESCSPFDLGGCTKGDLVDVSQPFPQCCKRFFTCKDNAGNEIIREFSPYSD